MGSPYRDLAAPAPKPQAALWRSHKLLLSNLLASVACACLWLYRFSQPRYPWEACVTFGLLSVVSAAGQYSAWRSLRRGRRGWWAA